MIEEGIRIGLALIAIALAPIAIGIVITLLWGKD